MFVIDGRLPTMTAFSGWRIGTIGMLAGNVWTFSDSTMPAYRSVASTTAASLRGQLWTTTARTRLIGRHRPPALMRLAAEAAASAPGPRQAPAGGADAGTRSAAHRAVRGAPDRAAPRSGSERSAPARPG